MSKNDKEAIIEDGLAGFDRVMSERGYTKEDIVEVVSFSPDSFPAKRLRMEIARRKKQRA